MPCSSAQSLLTRRSPSLSRPSSQPLRELPPRNSRSKLPLKLRSPFTLLMSPTSMRKRMFIQMPRKRKNQMFLATPPLARSLPRTTRNHLPSPLSPPPLQLALLPRIPPSLKRAPHPRRKVPNLTLLALLLLLRVLRKLILQLLPQLLQTLRMLKLNLQLRLPIQAITKK